MSILRIGFGQNQRINDRLKSIQRPFTGHWRVWPVWLPFTTSTVVLLMWGLLGACENNAGNQSQVEEAALREWQKIGVLVFREGKPTTRLVISEQFKMTNEALVHLKAFKSLRDFTLSGAPLVTDDGMRHIAALRELEALHLDVDVSDEGLTQLGALTELRALELGSTRISNKSLQTVRRFAKLELLNLHGTKVNDDGAAVLSDCKSLQVLTLPASFTGNGIKHICNLPKLRDLDVSGLDIKDADMAHFGNMQELEILNLAGCKRLTSAGFSDLRGHKKLGSLDVSRTKIDDKAGRAISTLKNLKALKAAGLEITGEFVGDLTSLPKLEKLDLTTCSGVDDEACAHLRRIDTLTHVNLFSTNVTDKGLMRLLELQRLTELIVYGTEITKHGANEFRKKAPGVNVLGP